MLEEYKKKYYRLLMLFTQNTPNARSSLLHRFPEAIVDEAIALGLIVESHKNDIGIPVYRITELGRQLRDN